MGYRSEVAYTIRFNGKDTDLLEDVQKSFYTFLAEAKSKPETSGCFSDQYLIVNEEECQLNFYIRDVKWYDDFPEVKCHDLLLELVDEYDQRDTEGTEFIASYLFRRIGESDDDCEERFGGEPDWDDIYLSRSLVVSWA